MRSSKSRSRSKGNRNRSVGNIVNRVFDSSGPEGKVRGTPQQIIDKYNQLARDAQLSNDRVAAENFQQHAEHYLRMLADAQREMQERQRQNQQNQSNQQNQGGNPRAADPGQAEQPNVAAEKPAQTNETPRSYGRGKAAQASDDAANTTTAAFQGEAPAFIDAGAEQDGGLVETPEDKPKRARRPRKKPEAEAASGDETAAPDAAE